MSTGRSLKPGDRVWVEAEARCDEDGVMLVVSPLRDGTTPTSTTHDFDPSRVVWHRAPEPDGAEVARLIAERNEAYQDCDLLRAENARLRKVCEAADIVVGWGAWMPAKPGDTPGQVEPDDARPQPIDAAKPVDLDSIEETWLRQCPACDAGLSMSCVCPPGDPRNVIANLVDEVWRIRRKLKRVRKSLAERGDRLAHEYGQVELDDPTENQD